MNISDHLHKAREAFGKGNYDYAIELLLASLTAHPNHADGRKFLREASQKRSEQKGGKGAGLAGISIVAKMRVFKALRKWDRVLIEGDRLLALDPNHASALVHMSEAAEGAGYNDTAYDLLSDLLKNKPDDPEVVWRMGHLCDRLRRTEEAIQHLERYVKMWDKRADETRLREGEKKLRDLQAKLSMATQWKENTTSFKQVVKSQQVQEDLEVRSQMATKSGIRTAEELEKMLAVVKKDWEAKPEDAKNWSVYIDLLRKKGEAAEALRLIEEGLRRFTNHFPLLRRRAEIQVGEKEAAWQEALKVERERPDDPARKAAAEKARQAWIQERITRYGDLVAQHPTDRALRFELGRAFLAAGEHQKATGEFQKSREDVKLRIPSDLRLAECWKALRQPELGEKTLKGLTDGVRTIVEDQEKEAFYLLADLYEAQERWRDALETFQRVLEVDIKFRDVSDRVVRLRTKTKQ